MQINGTQSSILVLPSLDTTVTLAKDFTGGKGQLRTLRMHSFITTTRLKDQKRKSHFSASKVFLSVVHQIYKGLGRGGGHQASDYDIHVVMGMPFPLGFLRSSWGL